MQQHVGDGEQVRQGLFLDTEDAPLQDGVVLDGLDLVLADVLQGADEEAAGAAGRVEDLFAQPRVDHVGHELGDGARRVVLAGVAGALEVLQNLLVDVAEEVALRGDVEVDAVDLVDHLADQGAGLHVVVGILEDLLDDEAARVVVRPVGEVLERLEEVVVDEVDQFLAGHALGVGGPGAPAQSLGDGGAVAVVEKLVFLLLVVEDLEKDHPDHLRDALGVAVDAGVLAHDVLHGFDRGADGHGNSEVSLVRLLGCFVEVAFQLAQGGVVLLLAAEALDDLDRGAEAVEGGDLQHLHALDVLDAFVGVLVQQGFEDGPCGFAVFGEVVALAHVQGALAAGEGPGVEGHVADEVEGVEVPAHFLGQGFEEDALVPAALR